MTWLDTRPGEHPRVRCDYCEQIFLSRSNIRPSLPPGWGCPAVPGRHVCPDCEPADYAESIRRRDAARNARALKRWAANRQ